MSQSDDEPHIYLVCGTTHFSGATPTQIDYLHANSEDWQQLYDWQVEGRYTQKWREYLGVCLSRLDCAEYQIHTKAS